MKNRAKSFLALLASMTGAVLILTTAAPESAIAAERGADSKTVPRPPTESGGMKKEIKPAKLSFGLEDVAKLVQSGVDTDVVLTFVENSTVAYYATADDVIHLHELGVPSQITASLIRHGGKLRAQQQALVGKVSQTGLVTPTTPNVIYGYEPRPAQSTYVTHNYGYQAYVYRGYPNCNYVYPGYSHFNYPGYFSYSSPFYFRHHYPYRYNRYYSRPIHSGIRVGFNSGHFFHGSPGIRVRGRF